MNDASARAALFICVRVCVLFFFYFFFFLVALVASSCSSLFDVGPRGYGDGVVVG